MLAQEIRRLLSFETSNKNSWGRTCCDMRGERERDSRKNCSSYFAKGALIAIRGPRWRTARSWAPAANESCGNVARWSWRRMHIRKRWWRTRHKGSYVTSYFMWMQVEEYFLRISSPIDLNLLLLFKVGFNGEYRWWVTVFSVDRISDRSVRHVTAYVIEALFLTGISVNAWPTHRWDMSSWQKLMSV